MEKLIALIVGIVLVVGCASLGIAITTKRSFPEDNRVPAANGHAWAHKIVAPHDSERIICPICGRQSRRFCLKYWEDDNTYRSGWKCDQRHYTWTFGPDNKIDESGW